MTEPGGEPKPRESRAFAAGGVLLVLAILACGVFAGLAGKKVGSEHVDFIIAFVFLGIVTLGIFGLAWVDASTRAPGERVPPHSQH
jgi:drug/metabolite transporter (DMT)-like permease